MVVIQISVGELLDKTSILQIKKEKISDSAKLIHVEKELLLLFEKCVAFFSNKELKTLYNTLLDVNLKLWDVEDRIRELENLNRFEGEFIDLARKVYHLNDERFKIKDKINFISNSEIKEIKNYKKY